MADVVHHRATVAELHALAPFDDRFADRPRVWWCDPTDAAVALGSRQRPAMLDLQACDGAGLQVVRRRSGGGAVIVRPGEMCWIDLVLPHGIAPDDVRGSMIWAGERWLDALAPWIGDDVELHRDGLLCTPWSDLVCWAGVGPGELIAGGEKLVGLSQRRSRDGLRIQGMVHLAAPVDDATSIWAVETPTTELGRPAFVAPLSGDAEALVERLAERLTGS